MSADTTPISPARFAAAIKELSVGMLQLKVAEIHNSIAHLQYSNDQLRPFAEGSAVALGSQANRPALSDGPSPQSNGLHETAEPDQDCLLAIGENELVIERMAERLALIRSEVEARGLNWSVFLSREPVQGPPPADETPHAAWTDGTIQTGTIRTGPTPQGDDQPGTDSSTERASRLCDEQLAQASDNGRGGLEEGNDTGKGLHL